MKFSISDIDHSPRDLKETYPHGGIHVEVSWFFPQRSIMHPGIQPKISQIGIKDINFKIKTNNLCYMRDGLKSQEKDEKL